MQLLKPVQKTAITWKDQCISYSELQQNIARYMSVLKESDHSRVAILAENAPEWIYALYAAWYCRAQAVPIDHLSSPEEVRFILDDCRPDVVFCSASYRKMLTSMLSELPCKIRLLVFDELAQREMTEEYALKMETDPQQTALIIYTSGTTGSPKGVMLSFANVWANIRAVSENIPIYQENERVLIMLPLHHTFPLLGSLVAPLAVGATVSITPSLSSEDILATIQNNRISIIIGVPRFYNLIRKGIRDKIDKNTIARLLFRLAAVLRSPGLSRKLFAKVHQKFGGQLKYLVCGGAAIDIEVARDYQTLGFEMLEGYGMTEAAPMITFTRPGRRKLGSAGEALPGTQIRIQENEILARGPNIMQGYYNRPQETREVIVDGWLHTGDTGHMDEAGFLFITGRKKEIIVLSNGKNINPVELESALSARCPGIAEIAVYAKNDQLHTLIMPDFARLKALAVHSIDSYFREIIDRFNMTVSSYKRIMKMTLVKHELPKTRLGKIQRFMLEAIAGQEARKKAEAEEPKYPEYQLIKDFLARSCDSEIHPDDHLEIDLGMDSLDKVNLLTFLQNSLGIRSEESLFSECATGRELAEYSHKHKVRISSQKVNWHAILKENVDITLPKSWFSQKLFKYALKISFALYFRLKGNGLENIPPTPCIITPNHQSVIDGFYITSLLRLSHLKKTLFFAKEKHLKKRWLKFIASRHNVIIMDINRDLKLSLQRMAAALKKGKNIIIFPEGTRTKDGNLGRFKKFFAILSKELNVPVVPVIIQGAFEALPTGRRLPRFRQQISVSFHQPIFPENHTVESLQESVYQTLQAELKPLG